ncbi:hypothetical protein [Nitrincola sp. MINF-07-Sa-05]|uniref:hypothetical protein n=1 Tax=Nitrincola salilacus TaxID=3400273 RepID=UPI003917B9D1
MSSITGTGFSTYTNHQAQRANTEHNQTQTTNITFGEAFNKATSTPKPSEQIPHSHSVESNTYSANANNEYVARTGNTYIDENGVKQDIRRFAMTDWELQYMNNSGNTTFPKLNSLSDRESYYLGRILSDIKTLTLNEFGIEANSQEYVDQVLLNPAKNEEVHQRFFENIQTDERMKDYIKYYST